jgi:hypothetical protein
MYAKLQSGFLRSAPKTITLDGKTINNPLPEELEQLGYKQVMYVDMPTEVTEGKHWESGWTEEENAIRQVWTLADDPDYPTPEPTPEERISNLETTTDELKSTSDDIILMMADIIGG